MYIRDESVSQYWRFQGELNLKNEVVHMFSVSEMKIQNRSLAASGSESTEAVSNNPLVGRLYDFKGGVPRSRTMDCAPLEYIGVSGVVLARAAQFDANLGGVTYKEPPLPKLFSNCVGASMIRLDPGSVKQDKMVVKYNKPLLTFLKKMGDPISYATNNNYKWLIGKCRLFALEDVINVNATAKIEIAYEVNREYGCFLTTMKPAHAQGDYQQITVNNETP